jgi:hypothetical protein
VLYAGVLGIAYGTSSAIMQDKPRWPQATAMGINYFGASYAILCKHCTKFLYITFKQALYTTSMCAALVFLSARLVQLAVDEF